MTDLPGVLTSLATLVGVVGGIIVQIRGQNEAREGRAKISEKVDMTATKVDENTALTKDAAKKVDAVHDEVVAASGTHPVLKLPDDR